MTASGPYVLGILYMILLWYWVMGFWFLLYLNNTHEKAQTQSVDGRKMLQVGTLIARLKKTPFRMWLDGIIIVIFAK